MTTLTALREKRASKTDALRAIQARAQTENRDALTDAEQSAFDSGKAEIEALDRQIRNAEFLAEAERREGGEPVGEPGSPDLSRYSIARAMRCGMTGTFDGLEGELHAELSRGRETRGVMIPTTVLLGEARSQTAGTGSAGGFTVQTNVAPLADRFRPALRVEAMGATVLRNLSGIMDLPNLASSGTAAWVAENGNATRSAVTFAKVPMAPKTVTGEYRLSRRLILQSNEAIEDLMRRDLGLILAQALDAAAIKGGATNQPVGILANSGVEEVTAATDLTDTAADLIAALELDDVMGTAAFLTNPTVVNAARKIKDGEGHNISLAETFHGQRLEVTTQVPNNGGDPVKQNLIYGLWSELVVGYWSAVDILVNPYHADVASNGGALIHAFLDADVAVRHVEAFRYAEV
ncbi:MAG: phage major capsid protein [Caulobacteraceae bacterium]|nr:phage major capsid protein [Caulobacteraceae bacterium]